MFVISLFFSFLLSGWKFSFLFYSSWFSLYLVYMSVVLYFFVTYYEQKTAVKGLSMMIIIFASFFFGVSNLLLFYMLFELMIFPMIILLYLFGSQPEKVSASYYAIIYTGVLSLPFFYQIMKLDGWLTYYYMSPFSYFIFIGLFMAKIPVFGLHYWLPKAHTEAPTSASMLLAGVMLKGGLYGLIKTLVLMNMFSFLFFLLSFLGIIMVSFIASLSSESKVLVAYSSVSHMNLGIYGINLISNLGMSGNYLISVSHGFTSALLFYLVGSLYEFNGTRIVFYLSSLNLLSGTLSIFVCMAFLGNAGVPPMLSFWSELMLLSSILSSMSLNIVFLLMVFMFSFYYSVYLMSHLVKSGMLVMFNLKGILQFTLGTLLMMNLMIFTF